MALIELTSNLSTAFKKAPVDFINDAKSGATGFTENFTNPNESKFIGVDDEVYSYPDTVRGGRLMQPSAGIAVFPGPQNFINDRESGATGFTLRLTNPNNTQFLGVNGSQFNYPTSVRGGRLMRPSINVASYPGPQNFINNAQTGAQGFSLFNRLGNSKFLGISGQTYTYPTSVLGNRLMRPLGSASFPGPQNFIDNTSTGAQGFNLRFTNPNDSKFIGISGQSYAYPRTVIGGRLIKPNQSPAFPGPVNFINDKETGVKGFTLRFTNPNDSKFLGISGQSYYYPNVHGRRLMKPNGATLFPGPQNFINDDFNGANGFNLKFNSIYDSKFLGIDGFQYTYPDTVRNNRLMIPRLSLEFPGPQNFFDDIRWGAKGFTLNAGTDNTTKFLGIEGRQYTYPKTVLPIHKNSVREVPLGNSKFDQGTATLENQLGNGSVFPFIRNKIYTNKAFSDRGYSEQRRYTDNIKSIKNDPDKSLLYKKSTEENSPSAIDEQYKKFNLQEESFNFQYINHPLILRGIQRKGKEKPNRWGVDAVVNFDDGSIRGGVAAVTDRIASDSARIGKWLSTPKGILWIAKQIGLGLTNPKVETNPLTPGPKGRQTRIHSGVTTLLSVAGNAIGLHFTRHGLPFVNKLANYEQVIKQKSLLFSRDALIGNNLFSNRLIGLANEYKPSTSISTIGISGLAVGLPSLVLSDATGGPGSVYGIGPTEIRRFVATNNDTTLQSEYQINPWDRESGYASLERGFRSSVNARASADRGYERAYRTFKRNRPSLSEIAKTLYKKRELSKDVSTTVEGIAGLFTANDNVYRPQLPTSEGSPDGDKMAKDLIFGKNFSKKLAAGNLRARTRHELDPNLDESETKVNRANWDNVTRKGTATVGGGPEATEISAAEFKSLAQRIQNYSIDLATPGAQFSNSQTTTHEISSNESRINTYQPNNTIGGASINEYTTFTYANIPKDKATRSSLNTYYDFRTELPRNKSYFNGRHQDDNYYTKRNIDGVYGFGKQGNTELRQQSKITQRGKDSFLFKSQYYVTVPLPAGGSTNVPQVSQGESFNIGDVADRFKISEHPQFRGDAINAIDVNSRSTPIPAKESLYPSGVRDFVKLIFEDPESGPYEGKQSPRYTAMVFRGTITGLSDSFSPGWSAISIMGRPDSAYMYNSFERSLSFTFTVAATSRQEMMPIWRKLNYLAGYTMPDFNIGKGKASGPMMRLTLGDLFNRCPGFLESLTYTIPDEATWDIADDVNDPGNDLMAKQLPMVVEVSVAFKVINDYRPQQHGRAYYLGSWLSDAEQSQKFEEAEAQQTSFRANFRSQQEAEFNALAPAEQTKLINLYGGDRDKAIESM